MSVRIVVDTNVFVSALLGGSAANTVLAGCLEGRYVPLAGAALIAEYEAQLRNEEVFRKGRLTDGEREELFEVFSSVCRWTRVYYSWRPNLRDEGDNHVVELAVAGSARAIVTRNVRDFLVSPQSQFPQIRIVTPLQLLRGKT